MHKIAKKKNHNKNNNIILLFYKSIGCHVDEAVPHEGRLLRPMRETRGFSTDLLLVLTNHLKHPGDSGDKNSDNTHHKVLL